MQRRRPKQLADITQCHNLPAIRWEKNFRTFPTCTGSPDWQRSSGNCKRGCQLHVATSPKIKSDNKPRSKVRKGCRRKKSGKERLTKKMRRKNDALVLCNYATSTPKTKKALINSMNFGARSRGRTGMVSLPRDFKSLASTNFAIRAQAAHDSGSPSAVKVCLASAQFPRGVVRFRRGGVRGRGRPGG